MVGKRELKKRYKARLSYTNQFNKENYKQISIRLSLDNESDIINWLDNFDSNKEYITSLIRKDMENNGN